VKPSQGSLAVTGRHPYASLRKYVSEKACRWYNKVSLNVARFRLVEFSGRYIALSYAVPREQAAQTFDPSLDA
jgi:hypothetical protein